ncbi:MAG: acetyl-CoA carboxylase carboxyltransferase subunit beta [Acidobacteria bacterium]|nr:acetyl-CoA carboxylase carboxyltransferase subunit beta [Acidobacteriota bacterium]
MAIFSKKSKDIEPFEKKTDFPEGVWVKCNNCSGIIYRKEVVRNAFVCPKCDYGFRIAARDRIAMLIDENKYDELFSELLSVDVLNFKDSKRYKDRIKTYDEIYPKQEAILFVQGRMGGIDVILGAMEFGYMGGSMGSVVGEKIARAAELAVDRDLPLIIVSASGGARMQEGAISLMQMAKVSAALARLDEAGLPYISILTDPTTGGVTASYAMLGDLNVAEPKSLIGFAGPRVIQQTIKEDLPPGFQRAEFLLEKGMLDIVIERKNMKKTLVMLLKFMVDQPA